jgi:hypothetical protein
VHVPRVCDGVGIIIKDEFSIQGNLEDNCILKGKPARMNWREILQLSEDWSRPSIAGGRGNNDNDKSP